jgi:hypothetical protein
MIRSSSAVALLMASMACGCAAERSTGPVQTSKTTFTPPYQVPGPGGKRELVVSGTGRFLIDVKPPGYDQGGWRYAVMTSYGGGAFTPELTRGGAYVAAGHGGHGAAQIPGFVAFDFTTGLWQPYVPSRDAAGTAFAQQAGDFTLAQIKTAPGYDRDDMEVVGFDQHPAPDHTYQLLHIPPRAKTGGVLQLVRTSTTAASEAAWSGSRAHRIALEGPGLARWSRASANRFREFFDEATLTESASAYDPTDNRIYYPLRVPHEGRMPYLDLDDATWKPLPYQTRFGNPREVRSTFVDAQRRLLVMICPGEVFFVRLDEASAVMRKATSTGTEPTGGKTGQSFKARCDKYPAADGGDDRWYTYWGRGLRSNDDDGAGKEKADDQNLYRLEIPADPVAGTWTWSTFTPSAEDGTGGLTAAIESDWANGAGSITRASSTSRRCAASRGSRVTTATSS